MARNGLSKEVKNAIRLRNVEPSRSPTIQALAFAGRKPKTQEIKAPNWLSEQQKTINDLKLQIEELRVMVFGRKQKKTGNDEDDMSLGRKGENKRFIQTTDTEG